ncbi:MAG: hypothetical protein AB2421_14385 [Thermotaleaceae bacterium]
MDYYDQNIASMQQPRFPFWPPVAPPGRPPFRPPITPPVGPGVPPFAPPTGPTTPPSGPPPSFVPQQPPSLFFVDPGAIRPCLFRFVYIWPTAGPGFWAYLIFLGPNSVSGFRWIGRNWVYFGMDLRNISTFICY